MECTKEKLNIFLFFDLVKMFSQKARKVKINHFTSVYFEEKVLK